jgi:hypothetical protein
MAEDPSGQQIGFWMRFVNVLQNLLRGQENQQRLDQFQRSESDRQIADGFTRGAEDPDARQRQDPGAGYNYDVVQQARSRVQEQGQQPAGQDTGPAPQRATPQQDTGAILRAQIEAFQQRVQLEQQQQRTRGQGRGL